MQSICVIGAGTMGRGIAYVAAINEISVTIHDINNEALHNAEDFIKKTMEKSAQRGFLDANKLDDYISNINFTSDINTAVDGVEIIIEAVFEKMDLKIKLFQELDSICDPEVILATNTSTMSPTEIAASTNRPGKCIAMHFFNPVHKMKLIEIIKGLDTSEDTIAKTVQLGERLGKETVEVNEFPGFVTSRMNCLIGNEAMNLLMEGVASAEDIDKAMKLGLNHPMGPLELADLVGLDSRLRNMEYLHETLGEKYRPSPILTKYVKAGRQGKKSGQGFYNYQ